MGRQLWILLTIVWITGSVQGADPRHLRSGLPIPDEGYCDQPYVVVTPDGNWLCVLTTGKGDEGQPGQHVVSTISKDRGKTWSPLVDIEPGTGAEASWATPLLTPTGRVYVFYDYNGDGIRQLRGKNIRADMLGWFVFKYSDDFGKTWSKERHRLPMRSSDCDRNNDWQGKVQIFWSICKPQVAGDDVLIAFTKLGKYMLDQGEGWVYRSPNLLTEKDVSKIRWDLWPAGERGIRNDAFGSVQEEHNLAWLGGQRWYCVYRTTTGYPCHSYSEDGGKTWSKPEHMTYAPGGKKIKTPRACPKLFRTQDGKLLFWFHNHSGKSFEDRNPAWLAGGAVKDGKVHWSQPEILLYDEDAKIRMSYPDLVEQDGKFWMTETQKTTARVHEVDRTLLDGLWRQGHDKTIARNGLLFDLAGAALVDKPPPLPERFDLSKSAGLALDIWFKSEKVVQSLALLDNRDDKGRGLALTLTPSRTLRLDLDDGKSRTSWESDAVLQPGKLHHVVINVDAGPRIITFVMDGTLCDGGEERQFGWGRWAGTIEDLRGSGRLRTNAVVQRLRVYDRYLRTSEAVAHYHGGS